MLMVPFLLLGLICVLLVFLLQRASKRHLGHLQEQLYSLEDQYRQLGEQLDAQTQNAAQQAEEAHRLMVHLEHELEEAHSDKQLIELRTSLTQLRQQFEEKTEVLHQTRKQLFTMEGELFALRKELREQECAEENAILRHAQQCEEECDALEQEMMHLHNLVSALLAQKPKNGRARKKDSEEEFFSIARE